ncbi:MAG: hypothetical protein WAP35_07425 [Solirubrobacterales bacterium]
MAIAAVVREMLNARPRDTRLSGAVLEHCVEALADCAQACTQCADDCLAERHEQGHMAKCIRLNLDCVDICTATQRAISRQSAYEPTTIAAQLRAAIAATHACAQVCGDHGQHMAHCGICAAYCQAAATACTDLLAALPGLPDNGGDEHKTGIGRAISAITGRSNQGQPGV